MHTNTQVYPVCVRETRMQGDCFVCEGNRTREVCEEEASFPWHALDSGLGAAA